MRIVRPLGRRTLVRRERQMVVNTDFGDPHHFVDGLDVALDRRVQLAFLGWYLARFQRTGQSPGESTSHRRDHVIERGELILLWFETVEVLDATVHAEVDRLLEAFEERPALRPLILVDTNSRGMYEFRHSVRRV